MPKYQKTKNVTKYHYHEVGHVLSVLGTLIEQEIINHPAGSKELKRKAHIINGKVWALYQDYFAESDALFGDE